MAKKQSLKEQLTEGICKTLAESGSSPQAGLEALAGAFLTVVSVAGGAMGNDPTAFTIDIIEQMRAQFKIDTGN